MIAIDLFAGAGGSSEGARQAGATIAWAANHWRLAVDVHRANHPETAHACQDLHQCDWSEARTAAPDIVLASPACQGHSRAASAGGTGARGSAPKHDADRSTAWAVVSCLEATRAPVAVVENVLEFCQWALYPSWLGAMAALGYTAHEHVINAADHGVPQHRSRLFVTLSRSASPLVLDLPTVTPPGASAIRDRAADQDDARWRDVAELPPAARSRIARAIGRCGSVCAVNYVTDDSGTPLSAPLTTVTTKHQRAWIRPGPRGPQRRMFTGREYARAMGFPDGYQLTGRVSDDCRLVGNAVCPPVMRSIVTEIGRRG